MKPTAQHVAEYALLRLFAGLVRVLPLRAALGLGWLGAAAAHFIGRAKVARTHARLREVFGKNLSGRDARRIAWISWRNLVFNGIEAMRNSRLTVERIRRHPMAAIEPELRRIREESPNGFILATPHMGNWEIAAIAADLIGLPIFTIVRKQRNPLVNDYINRMRRTFKLELVYREARMFKGVVDRLRQGRVLAILPDIQARSSFVAVDFLNGTAHIASGAAQFAQLANCPIYPVVMRRVGWTRHDAVLFGPVRPDPSADKRQDQQRMMQEVMSAFSAEICKSPEQYFWYNKRWILQK